MGGKAMWREWLPNLQAEREATAAGSQGLAATSRTPAAQQVAGPLTAGRLLANAGGNWHTIHCHAVARTHAKMGHMPPPDKERSCPRAAGRAGRESEAADAHLPRAGEDAGGAAGGLLQLALQVRHLLGALLGLLLEARILGSEVGTLGAQQVHLLRGAGSLREGGKWEGGARAGERGCCIGWQVAPRCMCRPGMQPHLGQLLRCLLVLRALLLQLVQGSLRVVQLPRLDGQLLLELQAACTHIPLSAGRPMIQPVGASLRSLTLSISASRLLNAMVVCNRLGSPPSTARSQGGLERGH